MIYNTKLQAAYQAKFKTRKLFAEAVGVAEPRIASIISHHSTPSGEELASICDVLKATPGELGLHPVPMAPKVEQKQEAQKSKSKKSFGR